MRMVRNAALALMLMTALPLRADFDAEAFPPYERCALCHGLFGVSHHPKFPNLAGQKPAYLEAQIRAFHDGHRTNDGGQMSAIVTELKPDDIPVVVNWFASQDPPEPVTPEAGRNGASNFTDAGCAACHSDPDGDAPHLTAQHAGYLTKQMEDFRDGRRAGSEIAEMHRALLLEAEIKAISLFLAATERP